MRSMEKASAFLIAISLSNVFQLFPASINLSSVSDAPFSGAVGVKFKRQA